MVVLVIGTWVFALELGPSLCLTPYQACDLAQDSKSFEPQFLCKGAVVMEGNVGVQSGCEDSMK